MHDRSFRAFIRKANAEPGAGWGRLGVALGVLGVFLTSGLWTTVIIVIAAFPIGVLISYSFFRRHGTFRRQGTPSDGE